MNDTNATYYCNRAAAYLELGRFKQAEADCDQAFLLDKKVQFAELQEIFHLHVLIVHMLIPKSRKWALHFSRSRLGSGSERSRLGSRRLGAATWRALPLKDYSDWRCSLEHLGRGARETYQQSLR